MNLEKIEELWKKDAEAFYDHRELPELLANDSMETPRLHAKYVQFYNCLLYTSPSPRDATLSRMPSSA